MLLLLFLFALAAESKTLLHLSDLHYDLTYVNGSWATCARGKATGYPCCHHHEIPVSPYRRAREFGDYLCDSPWRLLESSLAQINDSNINPDYIIWTGDSPGHNLLSQSRTSNLEAIYNVTELIARYFPNATVFPVLGNHDTWPVDQMRDPPNSVWLLKPVAQWWSRWLGQFQLKSFLYGGYYYTWLNPNLKLIALATTYYDSLDVSDYGSDPAGQWDWFEGQLQLSRNSGEKVWIIGHVYPGNIEATRNFSARYLDLVNEYHEVIAGQFFAHSHQDQFALTRNGNVTTGVLWITPSVTPYSIMNPSFRLFFLNDTTSQVRDYMTFHTNLTRTNDLGKVDYRMTYRAREFFNMTDINDLQQWDAVVNRMCKDDSFFQKWWKLVYRSNVDSEFIGNNCTGSCKVGLMCSMVSVLPEHIAECRKAGGFC